MTRGDSRPRVLLIQERIPAYRVSVLRALRSELATRGIELVVGFGDAPSSEVGRNDSAHLPGACHRPSGRLALGGRSLVIQDWRDVARSADLVIVNEGARFILNYWLLLAQRYRHLRVAFWGHGSNLNATEASRLAEGFKRRIYRQAHWWFAYTEGSRRHLLKIGVPDERISVLQNAVMTADLRSHIAHLSAPEMLDVRDELAIPEGPVGLFLGSLYASKRLDFLLEASAAIGAQRSDFTLVIAGDGPDASALAKALDRHPNVRVVGRVDGLRKAQMLRMADVLLLPGAVGLGILEGFAAGVPTVSTHVSTHGPEFEFLENGVNACLLPSSTTATQYAAAITDLLADDERMETLRRGARESSAGLSGDEMVRRFADGIEAALST